MLNSDDVYMVYGGTLEIVLIIIIFDKDGIYYR